ncbi:EsaB/YukD family protein, partial [Streptomyces sp. SA3_actF]|uniref:EsaB/YukD family protein n=1 Tax=Streptomyces sp. SA3_actF TaxID=682181 RepID=UPI002D219134
MTLVGERRRADLVLPAGEPVGVLLPEILRVLDDRVGERPEVRQLITVEGEALAQDVTLEGAGIADGAVLRLVRAEDAPSAPVVHDVSDEAAADLEVRAWRWDRGAALRGRARGDRLGARRRDRRARGGRARHRGRRPPRGRRAVPRGGPAPAEQDRARRRADRCGRGARGARRVDVRGRGTGRRRA